MAISLSRRGQGTKPLTTLGNRLDFDSDVFSFRERDSPPANQLAGVSFCLFQPQATR
ncbi:hypothetical protein ES703_15777 [subsurface metagenome]